MSEHPTHDFAERLTFSEGIELNRDVLARLQDMIPGATGVERSSTSDDLRGTDYWIQRGNMPPVSVDVKHRDLCPIQRWGKDDACIEVVSQYTAAGGCRKPGWTVDETKRTDLIVYTWPAGENGRRFWILYFPFLCSAAKLHWREWSKVYGGLRPTRNPKYWTLCLYVPRKAIEAAVRDLMTGTT